MVFSQLRQRGDVGVDRGVGVEAVDRARGLAGEERLLLVLGDLAGEEALAGALVVAGVSAGEALLVAVVDHRLAAAEEHQLVGEEVARQRVIRVLQEVADPAHVVVAEEGGKRGGRAVGRGVTVIAGVEALQTLGAVARRETDRRRLEGEVENAVHVGVADVGRELHRVGVVDLAEHEEIGLALRVGVVEDLLRPGLPEFEVHVLGGVDAEAVDAEVDPVLIHLHEAVHNGRVLGHEVVEPREVAVGDRLARPGRVAAVVVERRVVQPRGGLGVLVRLGDDRGVGEGCRRVELGEGVAAGEIRRVEGVAGRIEVGRGRLFDVGVLALLVRDHIGGVIGDDVEVDLDAAVVGLGDESLELLVRAEVRVDAGEVGDPVAVVARAGVLALALHRTVGEARRQPDRARAEPLDVVEVRSETGDVAAVEEALVGRVEPGREAVSFEAAGVVRRVAVGEPVGHDEVELLVAAGLAHRRRDERVIRVFVAASEAECFEAHPVDRVVEGEAQGRRAGDGERDVVGAAVEAVRLVPRVVERDLVLVRAGGHLELGRVHALGLGEGQLGGGAVGLPVVGAAQLGLQRPDEGDGASGFRGCRGGGRGRQCDAPGEDERGAGDGGQNAADTGGGRLRHGAPEGAARRRADGGLRATVPGKAL